MKAPNISPSQCIWEDFFIKSVSTVDPVWAVAQSPILKSTITVRRLKHRGYKAMLDLYKELNPSVCEPPYTRPAWFILSEVEGYGGVRGALR